MSQVLTPDKALIFRITHLQNIPWILRNGLHSASSLRDPGFVSVGDKEIIQRRKAVKVPIRPFGDLSDYVPFYFTPYSPMLLNIKTGYRGMTAHPNRDIVFLVSSLHKVLEVGASFLFTDRHPLAAPSIARFSSNLNQLAAFVPWSLLQKRDFKRDPEQPEKLERYQAEALIHQHLPVSALLGIVGSNDEIAAQLNRQTRTEGLDIQVFARGNWYF